jgi:hypothetical protein
VVIPPRQKKTKTMEVPVRIVCKYLISTPPRSVSPKLPTVTSIHHHNANIHVCTAIKASKQAASAKGRSKKKYTKHNRKSPVNIHKCKSKTPSPKALRKEKRQHNTRENKTKTEQYTTWTP